MKRILKRFFTVENKIKIKNYMKKKIRRIYFIVFHSHEAKTSLEISHLKCFLPTKAFSLSKRFDKFSEILHEIIKKKFQVKFLRDFSGEMFNSVRFTHEIKSSECFFDRFHTHKKNL